jgi:hypothetical protein
MEHLSVGRGWNFTGGLGRVLGAVAGRVRNGFLPRTRVADVWGPQDTGAHLAVTQGGKQHGPAS